MIKKICEVINKINKLGYQAYLIGGSSRDFLLSRPFEDIDITTNAPINIIETNFEVVDDKGKSLGSIKIKYKNLIMEITRFRKETYTLDSIYPHITYTNDINEDYLRRDFTINAIYLNPLNNQIVDPSNGLEDLMNFKIRFIGNGKERIIEDPTRIIRAIRIANKLNFTVDDKTLEEIKNNIDKINKIPLKKYKIEIAKTFEDLGTYKALKILKEYKIEVKEDEC